MKVRGISIVFATVLIAGVLGVAPASARNHQISVPAAKPVVTHPFGIAVDQLGNVYAADSTLNEVQKLSPTGHVLATWGGPRSSMFKSPMGVAVGRSGNIYVADKDHGTVDKLSRAGKVLARWGNKGNRLLFQPGGVATDQQGNVYVADGQDSWIEKLSPSGAPLTELGKGIFNNPTQGQFVGPEAVTVDQSGYVYVVDFTWVIKLDSSGKQVAIWGRKANKQGKRRFAAPSGVAVDSQGNIYVSEAEGHEVQKLSAAGKLVTRIGAKAGRLTDPTGVAVDNLGHLYVADFGGHRIEKYTTIGQLIGIWK